MQTDAIDKEALNIKGKVLAILGVFLGYFTFTGGVDLPVLVVFGIFAIYPFAYKIPKSWPLYLIYLMLLIYFAATRFIFKIDDAPPLNNTIKTFISGALFLPLMLKLYDVKDRNLVIAQKFLGFGFILALSVLVFESVSGYFISSIFESSQGPKHMERNLGRGAFILIALLWPVLASKENGFSKQVKLILFILTGYISTRFDINLNIIAFVISGLVYLLANYYPKIILGLIGVKAFLLVALAPQIYGFIANFSKNLFAGNMPLSYERRADMWLYAIDKIKDKPFFGHGLDSSKTFNETVYLGGFPWAAIQNHPHSAPLHIWLEGGIIGAFFFSCIIVFGSIRLIANIKPNQTNANALCASLSVILFGWALTYGMWQQWLWILVFLSIAYSFLAFKHKPIEEFEEL